MWSSQKTITECTQRSESTSIAQRTITSSSITHHWPIKSSSDKMHHRAPLPDYLSTVVVTRLETAQLASIHSVQRSRSAAILSIQTRTFREAHMRHPSFLKRIDRTAIRSLRMSSVPLVRARRFLSSVPSLTLWNCQRHIMVPLWASTLNQMVIRAASRLRRSVCVPSRLEDLLAKNKAGIIKSSPFQSSTPRYIHLSESPSSRFELHSKITSNIALILGHISKAYN